MPDQTAQADEYLEKFLEKDRRKRREALVRLILETTTPEQQVQFYGWVLSDRSHVQQRWCEALAKYGGRCPESARLWIKGASECPGGRLYMFARTRFSDEEEMARTFGEFLNRDLLKEADL